MTDCLGSLLLIHGQRRSLSEFMRRRLKFGQKVFAAPSAKRTAAPIPADSRGDGGHSPTVLVWPSWSTVACDWEADACCTTADTSAALITRSLSLVHRFADLEKSGQFQLDAESALEAPNNWLARHLQWHILCGGKRSQDSSLRYARPAAAEAVIKPSCEKSTWYTRLGLHRSDVKWRRG